MVYWEIIINASRLRIQVGLGAFGNGYSSAFNRSRPLNTLGICVAQCSARDLQNYVPFSTWSPICCYLPSLKASPGPLPPDHTQKLSRTRLANVVKVRAAVRLCFLRICSPRDMQTPHRLSSVCGIITKEISRTMSLPIAKASSHLRWTDAAVNPSCP